MTGHRQDKTGGQQVNQRNLTILMATLAVALQLVVIAWINHPVAVVILDTILLLILSGLAWKGYISVFLPVGMSAVVLCLLADPAIGIWVAVWLMLLPLFYLIRNAPGKATLFGYAQWAGSLIAMGLFAWLWQSMVVFWEIHPLAALFLFSFSTFLLGLQFGLFCLLTRWVLPSTAIPLGLLGAGIYTLLEYWAPLPFPIQLAMAFSWSPILVQIADLIGMTGVTFSIALISGCLYGLWESWRRRYKRLAWIHGGVLAGLLIFQLGYGIVALEKYKPAADATGLKVAMIQPVSPLRIMNVDVETIQQVAATLLRLSLKAAQEDQPDVLVWPEGAASFSHKTPSFNPEFTEVLEQLYQEVSIPMIVQDIEFIRRENSEQLRYYSHVSLIGAQGEHLGGYRKNILLPFAEYLPGESWFPFLRRLFPQARNMLKGTEMTLLAAPMGPCAPIICYEVIFSDFVRRFVNQEERARYLVNLTNDRWYGIRQQPTQHLCFAVFRAVENRVPVIRCTNSGISALVDARGIITHRTELMDETVLRGIIHPRRSMTFYGEYGDVIPRWILTPAAILGLGYTAFKNRRKRK